jgi:hypothetical protein
MATTVSGVATEFITFSRTSNATLTDSDGKIKWAPHNLLLASEQFDAASWTKTSVTVSANAVAAPNGTTNADTLTASGANGTTLQTFTAEAISYTFGVWLKRKTGTGNIQIAADSGTYTTVTITSDWALYTVTQTPAAGTISAGIRIVTSADAVEAWGASLYRSDLGGMKANTSAYPMYNPTTPKNLLGASEDFSSASWSPINIQAFGSGSVSNATVGPINGLQTADLVVPNTATAAHAIRQTISASNSQYTHSVYAKAGGYNYVALQFVLTSAYGKYFEGVFNLVNGTVETTGRAVSYTGTRSISSLGNGWYRCSITVTNADANASSLAGVVIQETNDPTVSFAGNGTSGIYLWGAQLSDSASLDTYVPNYGAAPTAAAYYGPRLDADPVTLAQRGLLVEELRANLLLYSSAFDTAGWSLFGAARSVVSDVSPATTSSIKLAVSNTATSAKVLYLSSAVAVSAVAHTNSVYAKASELSWIYLRCDNGGAESGCYFNVATGAKGTEESGVVGTITPVGNNWYRCTATKTLASGTGQGAIQLASADGVKSFSGTVGQGVLIYGAQLEAGSFATSYIPVGATTAGATRNADVASVSTQAFPYSSAESSIVIAYDIIGNENGTGQGSQYLGSLNAGGNERIDMIAQESGSGPLFYTIVGGSSVVTLSGASTTVQVNTPWKAGAAIKNADYAASRNGSTPTTVTTAGAMPSAATELRIGAATFGAQLNGHIRQITYIPRRLSNTELQTRTA